MSSSTEEDYYSLHSADYIAKTDSIDSSQFLTCLLNYLPLNGLVMDVGCGTGRDLLWLKQKGFRILGLERSESLARYAEQKLKSAIIRADFETYNFSQHSVDGLILTAALVHVPQQQLQTVLGSIIRAVKPSGIVYLSLKKETEGPSLPVQRKFVYWKPSVLEACLTGLGLRILEFSRSRSLVDSDDDFLSYLMRKASNSNR